MAVKHRRSGQAFMIATIIFAGLFLMATAPSGPTITGSANSDFREFFSQSLSETPNVFNNEISEKKSIQNVKSGLYRYNRFMLESSASKGIGFESYQLAVLPEEGEAVLINYKDTGLTANLSINGTWTNTTIDSEQFHDESFSGGATNVTLILPNMESEHRFEAYKPHMVYWMKMRTDDETWQNSVTG